MILVLTMAGMATRFKKEGVVIPKFMIKVKGKYLLTYSLESLPLDLVDKIVFIVLEKDLQFFPVTELLNKTVSVPFDIVSLSDVTRGQAETVLKAKTYFENLSDLIIYNIDTFFHSLTLESLLLSKNKEDGVIGAVHLSDNSVHWSFARVTNHFSVLETAEKNRISDYALTGFYHFSKANDFIDTAEYHIQNNILEKKEFYIAPMYNYLIKKGKSFKLDLCNSFIPLGTPQEISIYENN